MATADVNEAAARAAAAQVGADPYTDYRELLSRSDIDAVVVATPEYFHREHVVSAAEYGKHVICEKPMARTLADADAMISACQKAGVLLMIAHSRRFTRRYMEIHRQITEGAIGEIRLLRENERRPRHWLAAPHKTEQYWFFDPEISGGIALHHAIHEVDLFRWFIGHEPVSVIAESRCTIPGNDWVPDFISLSVRFSNGAIASTEISNYLPAGYPSFHQLEIYGTDGAIIAKDTEQCGVTRYTDDSAYMVSDSLLFNLTAYVRQLASFVDAIRQDKDLPMSAYEARAALQLALAADESARTGRCVYLTSPSSSKNGAMFE